MFSNTVLILIQHYELDYYCFFNCLRRIWRRCNSVSGDCNLYWAHDVTSNFSVRLYCSRFYYLYFVCLDDHIVAVSVRPDQLGNLSYVWSTFFVYLSYMMWLFVTTKFISSYILTMAPFISSPELLPSLFVRRLSSVVHPSTFHILIFSSETTGPIATKLWWNGPWMAPFQNYVRWSRLPTKMAAKIKIEKRGMQF